MLLSAEWAAAGRVRVYRGATVVDGTGAPRFRADVAVEGARIVAVLSLEEAPGAVVLELPEGAVEVDASGLVLAPGFIDMHARSDLAVLNGAARDAKILQGVTTEVLGQDGLGCVPLDDAAASVIPAQIAGRNRPTTGAPWRSMDDFLDAIDGATAGNAAVLVPQGDLRTMIIGQENRPATAKELDAMRDLLGAALDAGAFGMSSGVPCTPGMYADAAELEALCRVVAERGGHWAPHARNHGGTALSAYQEVLDMGRRTGCPIHLTHATMTFAPDLGRAGDLLALIDEAIADGVDVTLDTHPHLPDATSILMHLGHCVRELGILTLEEAVRHLAGTPAERLGLHLGDAPRGVVRVGATADLVLFDPETGGAFDALHAPPVGIIEVLVGGVPVVAGGVVTGATPGRALRMPPPVHRATLPRIEAAIDEASEAFVWTPRTPIVTRPGSASADLAGTAARLGGAASVDHGLPAITLVIDAGLAGAAFVGARSGAEAFRVTVAADGVEIRGATPSGVFRGATVLRQLRPPESVEARIPAGVWEGAPAYGWRGMMLDVARHFRPPADVRRLIDLLADHHLNVLHLHLTDDQGWRFEVPGFPRLTAIGARRSATQRGHGPQATVEPGVHEGFYTDADLRGLVSYGAERFVTLVPEVELPGHVQAALAAYPELGNLDGAEPVTGPWERFGVNPRTLAPTEASLAFGRAAIDALCDLFDSEWIGIGGDEVPVTEWQGSAAAAERMRELGLSSPHEIQPWFTAHFAAHVGDLGRTALAWDEVLEGDVPDGVRILAWRGPVAMKEALRRGIPVIACPDLEAYLDYPQSASAEEPIRVGPPLTIERAYSLRVEDGAIGGQANVWTEHLPTRDRVDFAMFPRLAATAERLWAGGEPGSFDDFARRLPVHLRRLAAAGVRYRPLDGPAPEQRRPGVPGKPLTIAAREEIVSGLVRVLTERAKSYDEHLPEPHNVSVTLPASRGAGLA